MTSYLPFHMTQLDRAPTSAAPRKPGDTFLVLKYILCTFKKLALLGFEQAWTPILYLTAPLCKLLRSVIKLFKLGHLDM